jgi:CheY-like chemotaxis protein
MRTEELLQQSQSLTLELQSQSEELQSQQEELRRSNAELEDQARSLKASEELLQQQQEELQQSNEELEEKAKLLEEQNRDIEVKNREIDSARVSLEEKAAQLSLSSKYKSEFLANMSHELRTPLNSLLILSKMLADNPEANLTDKQVEFARTINGAGSDLLALINDILDLSKVEAGKMDVHPAPIDVTGVAEVIERTFQADRLRARPRVHRRRRRRCAGHPRHRRAAPPAGAQEPAVQRAQVHRSGIRRAAHPRRRPGRDVLQSRAHRPAGDRLRRRGHRDRHSRRQAAAHLRGLPAGRRDHEPALRRHGPGPLDQPGDRPAARRGAAGPQRRRRGLDVHALPAGGVPPAGERARSQASAAARTALPAAAPAPAGPAAETLERPIVEAPEVPDDRGDIRTGDRVVVVFDEDAERAQTALDAARSQGFRALVGLRERTAVALVHEFKPDAAVLTTADDEQRRHTLARLKRHGDSRHVPVLVLADEDGKHAALVAGAAGCIAPPLTAPSLEKAYGELREILERTARRLLIVDDDETERRAIAELVGSGDDIEVTAVGSSEEALEALERQRFDCVVLDLKLPKMTGFALLERIKGDEALRDTPVIVHTGKELTRRDETKLRKYAESIVIKDVKSPERLLDETALHLHRRATAMPTEQREILEHLHHADAVFAGKTVLVVDDDVRNVFALTSALESRGMTVRYAENGREAIESLRAEPDVDLVLMDVMMPEMDGYETTQRIRGMEAFQRLPVIALTAKAMKGDREKSIAAGASDYITKPVDMEQLLSLMRVWLY